MKAKVLSKTISRVIMINKKGKVLNLPFGMINTKGITTLDVVNKREHRSYTSKYTVVDNICKLYVVGRLQAIIFNSDDVVINVTFRCYTSPCQGFHIEITLEYKLRPMVFFIFFTSYFIFFR